jgi:hypothetical protein
MQKLVKALSFFVLIFISFSLNAQYDAWTPAKVVLKNGTSFRGLVKFPKHSGGLISIGTTDFKYRRKRKAKTVKYGHETVEEVIFGDEDFTTVHFKYVPITAKRHVLMEEILEGKVSLFSRTVQNFEDPDAIIDTNPDIDETGYYYDSSQYFVIRANEKKATLIAGPNMANTFLRRAKDYFYDCEKIVGYLEDELYTQNDLFDLIEDYNLFCE